MTKYNSYKESGFEWLGEVPEHWELHKGKFLFSTVNERSQTGEEQLLSVSEKYGVIPRDNINVTMFQAESYEGYKLCDKGDLVINSLWAWSNGLGFSEYRGIVSTAYGVYRLKNAANNYRYFNYLLKTKRYIGQYSVNSKGIWKSRLLLSDWSFLEISILLPPSSEQGVIANFLDHKCEQIDRFISKKQELIARLEEKKQAVINQAVTKGLDPNVKMKSSGVEWLGDVPEHWEVRKLKFLIKGKLKYGANESGIAFREDYPRYIRITDFGKGGNLSDENKLSLEPEKAKDYLLKDGDILLARSGATVGKAYQFKGSDLACYAGYLIKAEADENLILSDFLYAYTKSKAYDSWKSFIYSKATIENISADKYAYLMVCYPNIQEQRNILEFVQEESSEIDTAITRIQEEITLIEEYKNALISEAVTGKIDVRAWQPKTTKTAAL